MIHMQLLLSGHRMSSSSDTCQEEYRVCALVCVVIGASRYSRDLAQGGMEVPCQLNFTGHDKEVLKIQRLVSRLKS